MMLGRRSIFGVFFFWWWCCDGGSVPLLFLFSFFSPLVLVFSLVMLVLFFLLLLVVVFRSGVEGKVGGKFYTCTSSSLDKTKKCSLSSRVHFEKNGKIVSFHLRRRRIPPPRIYTSSLATFFSGGKHVFLVALARGRGETRTQDFRDRTGITVVVLSYNR